MQYWLFKSEPDAYSWDQLIADKSTYWDGVRNFQAQNNMKKMKVGDRAFFYHSNTGREIIGVVEVVKEFYPDHTDPTERFGMVGIKPIKKLARTVSLAEIKQIPELQEIALIKQSRLSVMPISTAEWEFINNLVNT